MALKSYRWLLVPLLFILTAWRRLKHLAGRPAMRRPPRRILFIGLTDAGLPVLADPAMKKIRSAAEGDLFFLASGENRKALELLHTVRPTAIRVIRRNRLPLLLADTCRFLFWSRRNRIDTVVDLSLFSPSAALLGILSGADNMCGFHPFYTRGLYRGDLLTHRVLFNPRLHLGKNYIALADSLLAPEEELPYSKRAVAEDETKLPRTFFPESELANMHELVRRHYPGYRREIHRLMIIGPFADDQIIQRRWLPERYVELARRVLEADTDMLVLVTGAAEDRDEAGVLCKMAGSRRCVNMAGSLRDGELPALCSIAALMVATYCGSLHNTAVTALPVFVLLGPDAPETCLPLGNTAGLHAGLACSPCLCAANRFQTPCRDNKCMQTLSTDQVMQAIGPVLQSAERTGPSAGETVNQHQ